MTLRDALRDPGDPPLRPLPAQVADARGLAVRGYGDHVGLFNLPSASEQMAADIQLLFGQARRAMDEGRTVFLARITGLSGSTGAVVEATEIIQAVESLGWRLEQMSFVSPANYGAVEGYFLFRLLRPPNHTPSDEQPLPQGGQ